MSEAIEWLKGIRSPMAGRVIADYDQLKAENERLANCLRKANGFSEKFERNWYLVSDERDTLRKQLDEARELLADAVEWNWLDEDAPSRESVDAWLAANPA